MDSYVIKLQGKAELPKSLEIGHNFKVSIEGSITEIKKADNEDGSFTYYHTFKPVIVETIDSLGERIRARDVRSRSKQQRAQIWKKWRELNIPKEFEEFYDEEMVRIMSEYE